MSGARLCDKILDLIDQAQSDIEQAITALPLPSSWREYSPTAARNSSMSAMCGPRKKSNRELTHPPANWSNTVPA